MNEQRQSKIRFLMDKGVKIANPENLDIGDDVDAGRISGDGVVIHSGCRLSGSSLLICPGAVIGSEGPATVQDCYVGPNVELKGGFFKEAVFLQKSSMGLGAHVRGGTILEEESSGAHTVALKHTILFPFVTLGSLINFCDCFMSGGTSRKDHSEVGSSFIHFNYTPNQDKATPSLLGDVPSGVMLNRHPIFLGGQGGIVGPCRLAFGTVTAAGGICRKDQLEPGRLLVPGAGRSANVPFVQGRYLNITRTVNNNITYIANLVALREWYAHVRAEFISAQFPESLYGGLVKTLETAIDERTHRLGELAEKMAASAKRYNDSAEDKAHQRRLQQKKELYERFPEIESYLRDLQTIAGDLVSRDIFLEKVTAGIDRHGKEYLAVIQGLTVEDAQSGTRWLQEVVDHTTVSLLDKLPSFK
jgi:bifunctional UDP-N-acetylglucosamine pyrophosphorylase / glucosamine-1-phosphate N-acetyltransferase